ncbi:MAG: hypothetical protein B7Y36_04040 [Novosphingobium sp. 28-62-57]|uniref:hypothetical protein n=1 Tax=unclassified Novosphingobium TaxID=2644732 RepID=UPI000BCF5373|nr:MULTISPECIES: hypothetical protein [unclassified Novosphingobium]OYW48938.1 MAG: hypothetical protein B7Z34_11180 [Novosphingobium sp. 12-62-10]OYZ12668.1 MAG: hypothetical protein B7Y36_04040 [Novosphingobium sp. 28-62-57]OZA39663.1 MAG: hypothetical protein B7X92_02395 [Novosphingobium sp. 17-62-9]HQS68611.1 hypothetical protein [Novosphingobium sp.]
MTNARKHIALVSLAASTAFGAHHAHAAGVTAGTLIENTASASYGTGGATTTVNSNTVSIRVDELLDVAVSSLDAGSVPLADSAVLTYRLDNTGNGAEAFSINVTPTVSGNGFDAVVQTIAIDSNDNGTYEPGVDTVITNGAATPELAADGSTRIFVVVTQPSGTTDGLAGQVRVTAQALTGAGTPGTSFAGLGQGGGDAVVGATTANANALGALIASSASVALVKSFTIVDPFGGAKPVPGAVVTFTIAATASGSGAVNDLHVIDAIPAGTTYVANSVALGGTALTDAADGDAGVASASGIDVTIGTLAGGASSTVTFQTTIN